VALLLCLAAFLASGYRAGAQDNAGDPTPNQEAQTLVYSLTVKGPTGTANVAANAGDLSGATVVVTVSNPDGTAAVGVTVPAVVVVDGYGVDIDAAVSCSGVTDGNGQVTGSYTASDLSTSVDLFLDTGDGTGPTATVSQHWNDDGSPWQYDATFDYDQASTLTYTMQFIDGTTTLPLTGHTIDFITTDISGLEWDGTAGLPDENGNPTGAWVDSSYSGDDISAAGYGGLVTYSAVTVNGAVFTGTQTIGSSSLFEVDDVGFDAEDEGTYDASGA
jgi:hypothetical protein